MSCHYAEKVSLLIDGELAAEETREVERHLLECVECQEMRADFLGLRQQLMSYPAAVDLDAQKRALDAILPNRSASRPLRGLMFGFQWNFGRAALALASLLLIGLIIGVVTYRSVVLKKTTEVTATKQPDKPAPGPSQVPVHENATPQGNEQVASSSGPTSATNTPADRKRVGPATGDSKSVVVAKRTPRTDAKTLESTAVAVDDVSPVRSADAQTMTAMHFEKSELLLRAFRNVRLDEPGVGAEVGYERKRAQQLVYQNMMLRREADTAGDVQTATLLENLEPILIDIANLPSQPADDDIRVIKERVERKNIVALLQVNSAAMARGLD